MDIPGEDELSAMTKEALVKMILALEEDIESLAESAYQDGKECGRDEAMESMAQYIEGLR